jgi:pyruvate/2-oxoglutarate dehydrogenase complex dihydrolipoamide acyltransferase (E2) component
MTVSVLPRERRHTYHFLSTVRAFVPVYLDTEVDMTRVCGHREAARARGVRYSVVTYVLFTAARVLVKHPRANAGLSGRLRPRIAQYPTASGKLALDRTINGQRVVLAAVLADLDRASLDDIQTRVDHYRDGDPATMAEFAGTRSLHALPIPIGRALFRVGLMSLRRRPAISGTFSVSSLGHRSVDSFHSVGGTTITLGLGRIADRPVVRDGQVQIAPLMRLSLAFDHRVIDGAEAADVLSELKDGLDRFTAAMESREPDQYQSRQDSV